MSDSFEVYAYCRLCPRNCAVNRFSAAGYCGETGAMRIAWSGLHFGEEPPVSAVDGSGTVFFSGCNLGCVYCQNRQISRPQAPGTVFTVDEAAALFLRLQAAGAENINLVTGTPHLPSVIAALRQAKSDGLSVPVVWNCSGYETIEAVDALNEVIDIYLPDMKTADAANSRRYLRVPDYPETAAAAIDRMCRAKPPVTVPLFNDRLGFEHPLMKQGVIIRHLALPGETADSLKVMHIYETRWRPLGALFSLITDYLPSSDLTAPLDRRLTASEADSLRRIFSEREWDDCFFQEPETDADDWRPDFTRKEPFPAGFSRRIL
ncbi:MAG: radical SAM protein [Spirochaetia bacterium]|nr:radical SAM protein [Spirochaetia bacterium]